MKTYVWCEDSGAGLDFWTRIFKKIHNNFIVESKKNNSELCKAVAKIENDNNKYYILMDNAVDNPKSTFEKVGL